MDEPSVVREPLTKPFMGETSPGTRNVSIGSHQESFPVSPNFQSQSSAIPGITGSFTKDYGHGVKVEEPRRDWGQDNRRNDLYGQRSRDDQLDVFRPPSQETQRYPNNGIYIYKPMPKAESSLALS